MWLVDDGGVECRQRLVRRPRPIGQRRRQHMSEHAEDRMAGAARVAHGRLDRLRPILVALAHVGDPGERVPDVGEAVVVARGLEQRQRLTGEPLDLVGGVLEGIHSHRRGDRARECCVGLVFRYRRPLSGKVGNRDRSLGIGPVERLHQLELQAEVEAVWARERESTLEQRGCRLPVAAPEDAPARGAESFAGGEGEVAIVLPEIVEVAGSLFQVVAEELVQLDELGAVLLEPVGETDVQVGARRSSAVRRRRRLSAAGGGSGRPPLPGAAPCRGVSAPCARARPAEASPARRGRAPGRLRGGRSRPRPRRARAPSARSARAGRGGRRAAPATWPGRQRRLRLACHRHHLGEEERVAARGMGDPRAQVMVEALREELVCLFRCERLEPDRSGPGGAALAQLRPRHAEKEERRLASEQGGRLHEVEEGLLRPLDVVEQHDQRCLLFQQLAEGPGDLLGARCRLALAQQRADRRGRRGVGGKDVSCFSTSTSGQ